MVVQNLLTKDYQSKEARLFFLKQRADRVSEFMSGFKKSKSQVYYKIMAEVTGIEAVVTLQSFLLQTALYCRKYSNLQLNEILETHRAHEALAIYYKEKDFSGILNYLQEIKALFELIKNQEK